MRRKRRKKRIIQICIILSSLFSLIVVAGIAYMEMKPMVVKAVTLEAGTPSVNAKEFLLEKDKSCSFITDINSLDFNAPGVYEVQIKVNRRVHTSNLEIIDTIAPTAEAVSVIALKDDKIEPINFVANVIDATDVKASFMTEVDLSAPGEKDVKIVLEDSGKNIEIIESKLTILDVKSSVQVEAGSVLDVREEDFVDNDDIAVKILSDLSEIDTKQPDEYSIQVDVDGRILNSYINVVDTTPPTASAHDVEAWTGDSISSINFVDNISDVSAVKVYFAETPDFESPGEKEVTIIIEDYYGNKTVLMSKLNVKEDTEPPVFSGIKDRTIFEGDSVSYKKGVSVSDNRDKEVTFQVDSSKVNLKKVGSYKVYYTATDIAGNKAEETVTITVDPFIVTDEMLNKKVDTILKKITKEDMTQREVAWEIYQWVKGHVAYTGSSDKSDWKKEAYRGIVNGLGDCFTYYAVSEALLTRAEIDNMLVTRVGGRTQHFWNLVDCGDGWYHFDTCPNKDKMATFMLTDEEVANYTKKRGNNYYNFDTSLYPATPES